MRYEEALDDEDEYTVADADADATADKEGNEDEEEDEEAHEDVFEDADARLAAAADFGCSAGCVLTSDARTVSAVCCTSTNGVDVYLPCGNPRQR